MDEYRLSVETFRDRDAARIREDDARVVMGALRDYNVASTHDDRVELLAVFLKDRGGAVVGGLLGEIEWGWLHVSALWIHASLRRRGYGSKLMVAAEREALTRGCHGAYLDTFSFGAREFYEQRGYEVFASLPHYPGEHARHFMKKNLDEPRARSRPPRGK